MLEIVLESEQSLETLLRRVKELDLEIISLKEQRPDLESIVREEKNCLALSYFASKSFCSIL